jgi:hypothetical protein
MYEVILNSIRLLTRLDNCNMHAKINLHRSFVDFIGRSDEAQVFGINLENWNELQNRSSSVEEGIKQGGPSDITI